MARPANRRMPNFGLLTHQCHPTNLSLPSPNDTARINPLDFHSPWALEEESSQLGLIRAPLEPTQPDTTPGTHSHSNSDKQTHKHHSTTSPTAPSSRAPGSLPPPYTASRPHRARGRDWEGVPHHLQPAGWGWGKCRLQVPSKAGSLREKGGGMGSPRALPYSSAVERE